MRKDLPPERALSSPCLISSCSWTLGVLPCLGASGAMLSLGLCGEEEQRKQRTTVQLPLCASLEPCQSDLALCVWSWEPSLMILHAAGLWAWCFKYAKRRGAWFSSCCLTGSIWQSFGKLSSLWAVLECFSWTILLQWGFVISEDFLWRKAHVGTSVNRHLFHISRMEYELLLRALFQVHKIKDKLKLIQGK